MQNLLPLEYISPAMPALLPTKQSHAYYCDSADISTSVRSVCTRHSVCESGALCRTCGAASERVYSQCLECHRVGRAVAGLCGDCDCSHKSLQCCRAKPCYEIEPDEDKEDILNSISSSKRKFLPDTCNEKNTVNHSLCSNKSVDRSHSHSHKKGDPAIRKVIDPEIEKNEKRNLDHVPLSVPPLCSDRLKPMRHKTSKSVLSILETGEVCFELLVKSGNGKKDKVTEVCRISSDGLRVSTFQS